MTEDVGPIDWLLLEFDRPFTGRAAGPLLDLVDRGLIRILDLLVVMTDAQGDVTAVEISDLPGDESAHLEVFVGASSGLLGEEDVAAAGGALEPDRRAIFLVYENVWAAPFAAAVREGGGHLVAHGRIPTQEIIAALDELDAVETSS